MSRRTTYEPLASASEVYICASAVPRSPILSTLGTYANTHPHRQTTATNLAGSELLGENNCVFGKELHAVWVGGVLDLDENGASLHCNMERLSANAVTEQQAAQRTGGWHRVTHQVRRRCQLE